MNPAGGGEAILECVLRSARSKFVPDRSEPRITIGDKKLSLMRAAISRGGRRTRRDVDGTYAGIQALCLAPTKDDPTKPRKSRQNLQKGDEFRPRIAVSAARRV